MHVTPETMTDLPPSIAIENKIVHDLMNWLSHFLTHPTTHNTNGVSSDI